MQNKLYVGQLSFSINSEELGDFFASAGEVLSAKVIMDRDTGRSKGFGFVEMATEEQAQSAVEQFNGKDFNGRNIVVSIARPQTGGAGGGRPPRGGGRSFGPGRSGGPRGPRDRGDRGDR